MNFGFILISFFIFLTLLHVIEGQLPASGCPQICRSRRYTARRDCTRVFRNGFQNCKLMPCRKRNGRHGHMCGVEQVGNPQGNACPDICRNRVRKAVRDCRKGSKWLLGCEISRCIRANMWRRRYGYTCSRDINWTSSPTSSPTRSPSSSTSLSPTVSAQVSPSLTSSSSFSVSITISLTPKISASAPPTTTSSPTLSFMMSVSQTPSPIISSFNNISQTPTRSSSPSPSNTSVPVSDNTPIIAPAAFFGDPHLRTFDGLSYDCQGAGDFILFRLQNPYIEIQARFGGDVTKATLTKGIAIKVSTFQTVEVSVAISGRRSTHQAIIDGCTLHTYLNGDSHPLAIDEIVSTARVTHNNSRIKMQFIQGSHLSFRVQKSDSFGCFFNSFQVFLDESITNRSGIVGLLGSPNGDRADDWMAPNGNVINIPEDEYGKLFEQAYNYCTQNWCVSDEQQPLFTYSGLHFADLSKCDEPYGSAPDLSSASQELQKLCQGNTACLIDGLAGDLKDAESALEVQAEIRQKIPQTDDTNKCFVPNRLQLNQPTTVRISYMQHEGITANVTAYDVVELDNSDNPNRIGPNGGTTIVQLLDDGSPESTDRVAGDNIFTNQISVTFTQSNQKKSYIFIPIINSVRNYDSSIEEPAHRAIEVPRKPVKTVQTCSFDRAPSMSSSPSQSIHPSGIESQPTTPFISMSTSPTISTSVSSSLSASPTFSISSSSTTSPSASFSLPQTPSASTSATPTTSVSTSESISATSSTTMCASMTISPTGTQSISMTPSVSESSSASVSSSASIIPSQSPSLSASISSTGSPSLSLSMFALPSSSSSVTSTSSPTVSESILPTLSISPSMSSSPTPSRSPAPDPCMWTPGPPSCFDCPSDPGCVDPLCMWTPGPPSCFDCPLDPSCDPCPFGGCFDCPSDPQFVVDPITWPSCPFDQFALYGDPHMRTFDGFAYDCQGSGEFILFRTRTGNVEIQSRFTGDPGKASVTKGIAIKVKNLPILEVSIALSDSSSTDQIASCPIRTYLNGSERVLNGNALLESEVGVNVSSSTMRMKFGHHLIMSFVVKKSENFGCFFESLQAYMSKTIASSGDVVGLLGTPNGNPFDDWMDQAGNTLKVPKDENGKLFKAAYEYCTTNWCIKFEVESLFTHSETMRFDDLNKCDTPYGTTPELSSASMELKSICGSDSACLVDGMAGGIEDAENALQAQAKIEQDMSVGGVIFDPSIVRTGQTVNVRITVHLIGDSADSVENYDLVRINTESGDPIGANGGTTITKLFDDGSQQRNDTKAGDGIFTTVMSIRSDIVGERFSYALIPVVGGRRSNDPNIYRIVVGALRSYSTKAKVSIPPQVPKSEFSLSVSNFRGVGLLVSYSWTQDNQDLDSSTRFIGGSVGFACSPGSPYLRLLSETDNEEKASVRLDAARRDGEWTARTEVQFYAGWYDSSSSGPATLTVTLHNFTSGEDIPNRSLIRAIDPGTGGRCASKQVAKFEISFSRSVDFKLTGVDS